MKHLSLALDTGAKAELLWKLDPPDNGYILGSGKVYAFGRGGDAP